MVKNKSIKKENNNGIINSIIIIGIIFLITALLFMFKNNDTKDNYIKQISYSEYLDVIKKDEYSIILLTNPTCMHCNNYKPFVNYVASEYNINVYDINLTSITYDEYKELHSRYSAIKNYFSEKGEPVIRTPATIIVKNNSEVASQLGDIGYNGLVKLLKDNKVIK